MNFIKYCKLPENEAWITQFMYTMKLNTGYDSDALIDAVCEQAELEGLNFSNPQSFDEYEQFFSEWYDELECPDEREFPPRSGAI